MEHKWDKLDSYESDKTCYPIYITTWEQCEYCRCVRRTVETNGYDYIEASTKYSYSVGDGIISIQPTCVQQLPEDVILRQEIKKLYKSLNDLKIKSYQR